MDWLKTLHVSCVILSITGFGIRGLAVVLGRSWAEGYWRKGLPHYIDTILLVSAAALAIRIDQYPFYDSWLTAKVLALLAYIILGFITLRLVRNQRERVITYLLSMVCAGYIIWVARMRYPFPWEIGHPFY